MKNAETYAVSEVQLAPELRILQLALDLLTEFLVRDLLVVVDVSRHRVAEVAHELLRHRGSIALVLLA